jgi:hypothetical protein
MQLLLRIGMTSVLLSWSWAAYADPSQRIAESYVCLNNPASECRNPKRQITPAFACINNFNPECHNPQRPRIVLEPTAWSCRMNQNVICNNTIRYSVENRENWEAHFELEPRPDDTKR